MRKIKSRNTVPEKLLHQILRKNGIRYSTKNSQLPGKPDVVVMGTRIAVFVDGEFWHGYKWKDKKRTLKTNREYWVKKIEGNMKRDRKNNLALRKTGWIVVRIWQAQLKHAPRKCIDRIFKQLEKDFVTNSIAK